MLTHSVIPHRGVFIVAYQTPGTCSFTAACECSTINQAYTESDRLNRAQVEREIAIRDERQLRGLRGTYPDLTNG